MREPLTDEERAALSEERIVSALETLDAAFGAFLLGMSGAVQADPTMAMSEAKRNLIALTGSLHGTKAWRRMLALDE